ncbi:hypothetical protein BZA05DRAFT_416743 [Tricharina praecox]|uniref:uncharacterized protein n=1 Tax=Tricharina praecox TaxID=43433 RepID=UPI00221EF2F4|nr:uncharacterized protein BZA05DRAFT_416743 [Tricharina praecox]KAI5855149.1 hypothetical protein BZA05DRAFT_416743 [Tricharina praecox]
MAQHSRARSQSIPPPAPQHGPLTLKADSTSSIHLETSVSTRSRGPLASQVDSNDLPASRRLSHQNMAIHTQLAGRLSGIVRTWVLTGYIVRISSPPTYYLPRTGGGRGPFVVPVAAPVPGGRDTGAVHEPTTDQHLLDRFAESLRTPILSRYPRPKSFHTSTRVSRRHPVLSMSPNELEFHPDVLRARRLLAAGVPRLPDFKLPEFGQQGWKLMPQGTWEETVRAWLWSLLDGGEGGVGGAGEGVSWADMVAARAKAPMEVRWRFDERVEFCRRFFGGTFVRRLFLPVRRGE